MQHWQWQDGACWQACSAAARKQADAWVAQADAAYDGLRKLAARQPLTEIANDAAAMDAISKQVTRLKQQGNRLVVIGSGGASLGGQALCMLAEDPSRVKFLENCDPVTLASFLRMPKDETAWCIISKSGETVETIAAALSLLAHYEGAEDALRARLVVVTTLQDSTLMRLAKAQQWEVLPHPPALGGRFSVFSIVGLLPALFAGLDAAGIARAGNEMLQHGLQQKDASLLPHAVWLAANLKEKPMQLLMAYADRLRPATQWFKQLWAESLGKDGRGGTPVTAIGSIDQHSQLQLYLDGPHDKLLTLWLPTQPDVTRQMQASQLKGAEFLQGRSMGDVMRATAEATATTLAESGVPLRVLRGALTPESLASWMARQMLETLLVAHFIGVDPYSQPAVEAGKKLTRAALAGAA